MWLSTANPERERRKPQSRSRASSRTTTRAWSTAPLGEAADEPAVVRQPDEGTPHLRAELAACGVRRERVLFAPLVHDIGAHLARTGRASLLVDTIEYSSHTTGSDALTKRRERVFC